MKDLSISGDVPKIKAVMTPFPYFIASDATVEQARRMMEEHDIRHLPVQEDVDLVGVLSDRDLRSIGDGTKLVGKVMNTGVFVVDMDRPLDVVLDSMTELHIGCVLIRHHGKLAGIFTTFDVCRLFGDALRSSTGGSGNDAA